MERPLIAATRVLALLGGSVAALAVQAPPTPTVPEPAAAFSRVLALADARSAEPGELEELGRSPEPRVRAAVASLAGHLADTALTPRIAALAQDGDPAVRAVACVASGRLAAQMGSSPALEEVVRRCLADEAPRVRGAGAWAAGAVGTAEAASSALTRLGQEPDLGVRAAIVQELWRFDGQPWVAAALQAAGDRDARVRFAAAFALARGAKASPDDGLARLAADQDPLVRVAALGAARRGAGGVELRDAALRALDDADPRVRIAALDALAANGSPLSQLAAGRVAAMALLSDPERVHERVLALRAAGASGCCFEAVERASASADPWIAAEGLAALVKLRGAAGASLVDTALKSPDPERRRAGVAAAAALPDPAPALAKALSDSEVRVRLEAATVASGVKGEAMDAALARRLDDPDPAVRAAAVEALATHGSLPPAPRLEALLGRESGEAVPDAAVALVGALAPLAASDPKVRARLEALRSGVDPVVARAAWKALRDVGVATPLPGVATGRDAAFYTEVAAWSEVPHWLEVVSVRGTMVVALDAADAPITTHTLADLASKGTFDGLTFHRVVPDFVIQGGDPRGDGWGGPGFVLRDELSLEPYREGVVGLALAGPDTGGSQLFVTLTPQPHLDGRYPLVGWLTAGLDVAERIRVGDRILAVHVGAGQPPVPFPVVYGRLDPARLETLPGWTAEREGYHPEATAIGRLGSASLRYGISVVMGTWCSDSRELVPHLQRVLASIGPTSPFSAPQLVGVDRSKEAPAELWKFGTVEKVPTLVVTLEGTEIGRIVETPSWGSVEEDLVRLLAPYEGWEVGNV